MVKSPEKTQRLTEVSTVLVVIAHIVLALGIIMVFSWPLFGLAFGFVAAMLYISLLVIAEVFRKMATPQIVDPGLDSRTLRRRKIFRIVRYAILALLGALIIISYAKSALK